MRTKPKKCARQAVFISSAPSAHESRRIDNQLRGRSGRQGDPGHSRFYLSAEDDLLRLFAGDRFYTILDTFKSVGDMPIEAKMLSNMIESAQKKVEANNFATRRNVLKFDDVMNKQREVIYGQRNQVLDGVDLHATIQKMIHDYFTVQVEFYCPTSLPKEEWNIKGMLAKLGWVPRRRRRRRLKDPAGFHRPVLKARPKRNTNRKKKNTAKRLWKSSRRKILLQNVDLRWMDHIDAMEELKRGIYLRSYGQQDPVVAFRMESFDMFDEMTARHSGGHSHRHSYRTASHQRRSQTRTAGENHRHFRRFGRQREKAAGPQGEKARPERSLPLRQRQKV